VLSLPERYKKIIERGAFCREIDGLATLTMPLSDTDCQPALWLVSARGYDRTVHEGFLASHDGHFFHAATKAEAVAGAQKKARIEATKTAKKNAPKKTEAELVQARCLRLRRHHEVMVTVADSAAAGNCATGTTDWAAKNADGKTSARIVDVLMAALASGDRVGMAIAACEAAAVKIIRESRRQHNVEQAALASTSAAR
jgi:hypothetical protein